MRADPGASASKPHVAAFFLWVLALSTPLYLWGVLAPVKGLPFGLPATAVMVVVPAAVATVLVWHNGRDSARALWRRIFDIRRARLVWIATAISVMPLATVAAYVAIAWPGRALPAATGLTFSDAALMIGVYGVGAALEEIGWTGYATAPLQARFGVVGAGALLGCVWALWHVIPWWFGQGHPFAWVAGQFLATVLMRVIMGAIYARGGQSVALAVLFHTMINVSYSLFPNQGSAYDPWVLVPILALVALILSTGAKVRRRRQAPK